MNQSKENAIVVKELTKTFTTKVTKPGIKGSIRGLFHPEYKETRAVDGISFSIPQGQLVGFIGPNGAGKSTTLKILTGILFPSSGEVSVLGITPWKDRKRLAYHVGTVFGQRSQLWLHLPCRDSFDLFAEIYKIEKRTYERRLKELVNLFEIKDLLDIPVRKLSLGQRMRAELVAALLHGPKVLYLDEPSIGLDIIAKKKLRELIKRVNAAEGITVIFTSHDMDDIESVCSRVIVINHGTIIYDASMDDLRRTVLKQKIISVSSQNGVPSLKMPGVSVIGKTEFQTRLKINTQKVRIGDVLSRITSTHIDDIEVTDPPIEEIIAQLYETKR